jgi:hypothetical protein
VRVQPQMVMAFPPGGGHRTGLVHHERIKTSPADRPGSRQPGRTSTDDHDMLIHDASVGPLPARRQQARPVTRRYPAGISQNPQSGMTVCPLAVILGTSFDPWEPIPGSFKTGCGETVLGGGGDELNWSQRYRANLEKLASGDLVQVVEVVRDLAEREASRGLSAGEKRMLAKARLILLQEG